jgi:serine/threonine protein kinase
MPVRIESQAEPIPGYKLIERLGGGGFGEVWKVEAPGGIHKAIKFVYGDLETTTEDGLRAEQELKALSRVKTVRHPYILSLERFDIIEGQLLIVTELADRNLWDRFRECRHQGLPGIPRDELLRYLEEAAEALDLMNNEYQLQHLDIKPQNLFLVHNHAKVADFGLVKDLQGMMASVTGGVTPVYAAPETFDGWVSRFSDQYSLAIVYQELLTGQRPFNGGNVRQLVMQHLQAAPNLSSLPPGDRAPIARALAKSPDDRFPTCRELLRALRNSSGDTSPTAAGKRSSKPTGRIGAGSALQETPSGTEAESVLAPRAQFGTDGDTHWIRNREEGQSEESVAPTRFEELVGDGVLFPALVIGLGQQGLSVLQHLREAFDEHVGGRSLLPNVRFLFLDTDPQASRQATQGPSDRALAASEVLPTKLRRASHYLRPQGARGPIETWFHMKMLYRIPRNYTTTGLRALGRLAFFDNYRLIAGRLEQELKACTAPDLLVGAIGLSKLGLRTNRPRVYIVTSLAGGTGSGMFIDLAYVVRQQLKKLGYDQPDVVGVFLLPPVDRQAGRTVALGNTYAALTELNHFSTPGTTFTARYDQNEKPFRDPDPPFSRCVVLPLGEAVDKAARDQLAGMAADFLYRELATPLGRIVDQCRAAMPTSPGLPRSLTCQTFGMHRISWPRRALLQQVGRRLCRRVVHHWMNKDATAIREAVAGLVREVWQAQSLDGEYLIQHLEAACEQALGQKLEAALAAASEPLNQVDGQAAEPPVTLLNTVYDRLEEIVGRPEGSVGNRPGSVAETLNEAARAITNHWGQRLASFAVSLIEQPEYRLAGAEEAIRQSIATIEQTLLHYEPLCKELAARSVEAYSRIAPLVTSLHTKSQGGRVNATLLHSAIELLRVYPRWRYQSSLLHRVVSTYLSLRGHLSEQLRELNYCRTRMGELLRHFGTPSDEAPDLGSSGKSYVLFPDGCTTFEEATKELLETVTPQEAREFDTRIQTLIRQQFTALVHVCLTPSNLLKNLAAALFHEAQAFMGSRLAGTSVNEMYLAAQEQDERAREHMAGLFREAVPELTAAQDFSPSEIAVVAVPEDQAAERVRDLARRSLSGTTLELCASGDDIALYREVPDFPLGELDHLGPLAHEAYRQMSAVEHFTPHSRVDISEWRGASPALK